MHGSREAAAKVSTDLLICISFSSSHGLAAVLSPDQDAALRPNSQKTYAALPDSLIIVLLYKDTSNSPFFSPATPTPTDVTLAIQAHANVNRLFSPAATSVR
jgi:hypothetical protein